jgi:hypothetical protein
MTSKELIAKIQRLDPTGEKQVYEPFLLLKEKRKTLAKLYQKALGAVSVIAFFVFVPPVLTAIIIYKLIAALSPLLHRRRHAIAMDKASEAARAEAAEAEGRPQ